MARKKDANPGVLQKVGVFIHIRNIYNVLCRGLAIASGCSSVCQSHQRVVNLVFSCRSLVVAFWHLNKR